MWLWTGTLGCPEHGIDANVRERLLFPPMPKLVAKGTGVGSCCWLTHWCAEQSGGCLVLGSYPSPCSGWVWPLRPARPLGSGFTQALHTDSHPGKPGVFYLPMIDLNPGNYTCIYSTIVFVCKEAKRHSTCPIITFDQTLFWKAQEMKANKPDDMDIQVLVFWLGRFMVHMIQFKCENVKTKLAEKTSSSQL